MYTLIRLKCQKKLIEVVISIIMSIFYRLREDWCVFKERSIVSMILWIFYQILFVNEI